MWRDLSPEICENNSARIVTCVAAPGRNIDTQYCGRVVCFSSERRHLFFTKQVFANRVDHMGQSSFKSQLQKIPSGLGILSFLAGLVIGLAYGAAFHNLGVGILLGIFIGYIIASTLNQYRQAL